MQVPLGERTLEFELPACAVDVAEPSGGAPVDPAAAAERALEAPHGPSLSSLVAPDDDVAVVVTDVTRATPDGVLLAKLAKRLPVDRDAITVVVGLGLHRPLREPELRAELGRFADRTVNHDPDRVVRVGEDDGTPIRVHEAVADADVVLSTGMVEPHQYAGFSGGAKTVVVGAGDEAIIRRTHGPEMIAREGVRLGRVDDNPFREAVDRAGDVAGPDFCLNVTHSPAGILDAAAGRPRDVVANLAASAREALSVTVEPGAYDAVVAGVGAPKDATLYQASRAATYVLLGACNPVREGGRVVIPARLDEGAGRGTGERRFAKRLREADSADALFEAMRDGYEPGAQRAFVVARVLSDYEVWVTNSEAPDVVEECLMHAADDVVGAVEPGSDVLVVPDALNTLLVGDDREP